MRRAEAGRERETDGRNADGGSSGKQAIRPPTPPRRRAGILRPTPEAIEHRAGERVSEAGRSRSASPEARTEEGQKGKKGKKGSRGGGKKGGK